MMTVIVLVTFARQTLVFTNLPYSRLNATKRKRKKSKYAFSKVLADRAISHLYSSKNSRWNCLYFSNIIFNFSICGNIVVLK